MFALEPSASQASLMIKAGGQQWLSQVNQILDSLSDAAKNA